MKHIALSLLTFNKMLTFHEITNLIDNELDSSPFILID